MLKFVFKQINKVIFGMILIISSVAHSQEIIHVVAEGETLGTILQSHNISPLWGPKGNVLKAIQLNPGLITESGELPATGTEIKLPAPKDSKINDVTTKVQQAPATAILKVDSPKKENLDSFEYTVETGDTVGSILQKNNISPLWGPKGNVLKTIELNKNNPAFIQTDLKKGLVILLPKAPSTAGTGKEITSDAGRGIIKEIARELIKSLKKEEDKKIEIVKEDKPTISIGTPIQKTEEAAIAEFTHMPGSYIEYRVQAGDTIGSVLQKFNITPLWGLNGHVQKTIDLNTGNPNFRITDLQRGTKILLPIPKKSIWDADINMFLYELKNGSKVEEKIYQSKEEPKTAIPDDKTVVINEPKNEEKAEKSFVIELLNLEPEQEITASLALDTTLEKIPERKFDRKIATVKPEEVPNDDSLESKYDPSTFYLTREREYGPLKLREGEQDYGIRTGNRTYFWYRIRRGETISEILYQYKVKPLWGAGGYVQVTTRINDGKVKKSGDSVAEGEWIRVPIPAGEWEQPVEMTGPAEPEVKSIEDDIPQIPPAEIVSLPRKPAEEPIARACEPERAPAWLAPDIIRKLEDYERLKRIPQAYEEHMNPSEQKYGSIKLGGIMRFSRAQTTQKRDSAKAVLSSDVDTEANLDWAKNISERWDLSLGYQYRNLRYKSPSDRAMISDGEIYQSGYIGGIYHYNPNFQNGIFLGYEQRPYLKLISDDSVTMANIGAPYLASNLRYDLFFHGPLYISVEGGGRILFGASQGSVSSGVGLEAYGLLEQRILMSNNHAVGISVRSEIFSGKTNVSTQTDSSFGINLFWIWTP